MDTVPFFQAIIKSQKRGRAAGICSVCSAHPLVLEAAMERSAALGKPLLLEATANQVNQYGGYMGLTPAEFRDMAYGIADRTGLKQESLILGGDHLGPLLWSDEDEASAMPKAEELVRAFVSAGFSKIHIDTSMHLADDDIGTPLSNAEVAGRAATLCKAAEAAATQPPMYVIGSEVPVPGGSMEHEDAVPVTTEAALRETIAEFKKVFIENGLADAWERVIAAVVQPGVEFSDKSIILYDREKAASLTGYARSVKSIVLEGHSTDYQPAELLNQMREDGIAILKVGPALTFALREGLFAMEQIERSLFMVAPKGGWSDFSAILDMAMIENPAHWAKHYHGTPEDVAMQRKYSLSDRCRYYLSDGRVEHALERLCNNLQCGIPLGLLMQYMPKQAEDVIAGRLSTDPDSLVKAKVKEVLKTYDE